MFCSNCGKEILMDEKYCSTNENEWHSSGLYYQNYLKISGGIIITIGSILGYMFISGANSGYGIVNAGMFLVAGIIILYAVVNALLYYGLHQVLVRIIGIEKALGIIKNPLLERTPVNSQTITSEEDDIQWELPEDVDINSDIDK